jgi:hypothetical protein
MSTAAPPPATKPMASSVSSVAAQAAVPEQADCEGLTWDWWALMIGLACVLGLGISPTSSICSRHSSDANASRKASGRIVTARCAAVIVLRAQRLRVSAHRGIIGRFFELQFLTNYNP